MRRWFFSGLVAVGLMSVVVGRASAQEMTTLVERVPVPAPLPAPVYDPPGFYGMAWGVPSYRVPRTHSNFASPFGGVGYGYGYDPYTVLPGAFGTDLWQSGGMASGSSFAPGGYRTFPIPKGTVSPPAGVPVGVYAPWYGPSPADRRAR